MAVEGGVDERILTLTGPADAVRLKKIASSSFLGIAMTRLLGGEGEFKWQLCRHLNSRFFDGAVIAPICWQHEPVRLPYFSPG
jgi:hypothetical protein